MLWLTQQERLYGCWTRSGHPCRISTPFGATVNLAKSSITSGANCGAFESSYYWAVGIVLLLTGTLAEHYEVAEAGYSPTTTKGE
jgi:hypothetical protein